MARRMRHAGAKMNVAGWENLMAVGFGELADPDQWESDYALDDTELPVYFCDNCDTPFPGDSPDFRDAPTKCPYCSKPPGAQGLIVTYGGKFLNKKQIRTFPFYQPAPTEVPELPVGDGRQIP